MAFGETETEAGAGTAEEVIGVQFIEPRFDLADAGKNHETPTGRELAADFDLDGKHGFVAVFPALVAAQIVVHAELAQGIKRRVAADVAKVAPGCDHGFVAEAI